MPEWQPGAGSHSLAAAVTRKHEELPSLSGVPVLLLAAKHDERRAENDARDLADQFISAGADVRLEMLAGGHGWAEDAADEKLSRQWLATKEPG